MAKTAIPKSKAKTAYGLLSEVRTIILEEPQRYDQGIFNSDNGKTECRAPKCGTVACVAGWIGHLKGFRGDSWDQVDEFASKVLGFGWGLTWDQLFDPDLAGDSDDVNEHAKRGAEVITRFQQKYAAQLKAKRV